MDILKDVGDFLLMLGKGDWREVFKSRIEGFDSKGAGSLGWNRGFGWSPRC